MEQEVSAFQCFGLQKYVILSFLGELCLCFSWIAGQISSAVNELQDGIALKENTATMWLNILKQPLCKESEGLQVILLSLHSSS